MFKKSVLNKNKAISLMNFYGENNEPFLFVIDFQMKNNFVKRLEEISTDEIKFSFNNFSNTIAKKNIKKPDIKIIPPDFETYLNAFEIVQKNIKYGNSYLVNLTFLSEITTSLRLTDIYEIVNAKYKMLFYDDFLFFSPEIFVQIKENKIFSFPMKGTIDATIPNAREKILNDKKETAEHYTIVDLIRNDLNIVAKKVKVEKFRYIDEIKTNQQDILQVSSMISGKLNENWQNNVGNIIFSLLPAGSITGAPKKKTVEIIEQAENYQRGFYTGIAGIFDGKNLDSCVMIRFIENIDGQFFYKSGGGITALSNPKSEYQEMISKIYLPE
jgi:para-aminobenzoate synthetase component 1